MRQAFVCAAIVACCVASSAVFADRIHMIIPAGPGGGLDGTAREAGRAMQVASLVNAISFENISGGGGGRAFAQFVEMAERRSGDDLPLLINSAPLIVRSLQGLFPFSFRDLRPIAALVADYGIFVVRADDPSTTWHEVLDKLRDDPRGIVVGGGSVRGSLDHIVLALALDAAGIDPRRVRYLPYDGGGKAVLALLGGEVDLLTTGVGETTPFIDSGEVRVLASTSPEPIAAIGAPTTLRGLGFDVVFANWRGVFGPVSMNDSQRDAHIERIRTMRDTAEWRSTLERRGWAPLDVDGDAFSTFLEAQEEQFGSVMRKLGFIR